MITSQDDIIHEEILQAALRLYRKFGPTKVTMDNLAKATDRSRTSLYYYFKDRDAIFQAVMERIAEDVAGEIRSAVTLAKGLDAKIYAFCLAKIKTTDGWKRVFLTMDQLMGADEKSKHSKLMDALHKKLMHLESGILVDALSGFEGQKARIANTAEFDMLAFIISSSVRGVRREFIEHNDPHDPKAAAKLLSDMVAKWLQS
jgi:AcrR family transcriptional regulator